MRMNSEIFGHMPNVQQGAEAEPVEPLVIVPVPLLVDVLAYHEQEKGRPLTETEVSEIASNAICMTMTQSNATALAEGRGYSDINPDEAWEEWRRINSSR